MQSLDWSEWVGRVEILTDSAAPHPLRALAATLGETPPQTDLPPLWHWVYFLPTVPMDQIGPDGHPRRGGFLPPVPLERRMWAGGRLTFHQPVRVGEPMTRRSEILKISAKSGKAGEMVFVTVGHRLETPRGLAVEEEQDIVYVAQPDRFTPPAPVPAAPDPDWSEAVAIDEVRLFRFSAVTFNAHRIHFDLAYATGVEKYPGLVVHGPMQAMLLIAAAQRHGNRSPASYRFRGVRPLFHHDPVNLQGVATETGMRLATVTQGLTAMEAEVTWRAA